MTHTQGPWNATDDKIHTTDGNEIAAITRWGAWINKDNPTAYGRDNPIWKANAKLIAAAPDLLQAAKYAVEIIRESWGDDQIERGDDQACNILLAAIAKAEGAEQ